MSDRWGRLAPLTGVLFGVVGVVAAAVGGETPESSAAAGKIVAYYTAHRSGIETSSILFVIAFIFSVAFAAALRSYLRRSPGAEGPAALALAGSILMAVGASAGSAVEYGLAHNIHRVGPETAQTLNILGQELFVPLLAGALLFGLGAGIAILRGAALPKWLGWAIIVIGIVAIVPPAAIIALIGFVIWSIVTGILIYLRTGQPELERGPVPEPAV